MLIRREAAGDEEPITGVHRSAFPVEGSPAEPVEVLLVERLRSSVDWLPRLSLVAVVAGHVVGHVVCSRAAIEPNGHPVLGLGPVGVRADSQGRGIGTALMHAVLGAADACDEALVGVLGEPDYYRRFGCVTAAEYGIEAPDPGWGEHFQVRTLSSFTADLRGRFRYAPAFDEI